MRWNLQSFALLCLPLLAPPGAAAVQAPAPAVLVPQSPPGEGTASLKHLSAGAGTSVGETAAQEVGLGTTTAREAYNELRQSVALLAGGGYASVWETQNGSASDVWMQWTRPDGSTVFPAGGRAVANSDAPEFNPVVVANPKGGAFVAFQRTLANGPRIVVQSYDAGGNPRWAAGGVPVVPADGGPRSQREPHLLAVADGGVFACFQDEHVFDDGGDVSCQRLSVKGRRLWTDAGHFAGGLPGWKILPKLVADGSGGFLVVWRNLRLEDSDRVLIEGQRFTANGTPAWGAAGKLVHTTHLAAFAQYLYSQIAAVPDGHGGAVVTFDDWDGQSSPPSLDVFAQRVAGDGSLLWGDGVAIAAGTDGQQHDSSTPAPDGGAFVTVWNTARLQLTLYRLMPTGRVRWSQRLAAPDADSRPDDWSAHGSYDGGKLRIVWTHQRQDGTDTINAYLAVFDLGSPSGSHPTVTPFDTAAGSQFVRGFVFDPARRQGFAVWNDTRKDADLDTFGGLYTEAP